MASLTIRTMACRTIVGILILAWLAGCAQVKDWMYSDRRRTGANGVILGAPAPEQYLNEMYRLATGDPATQAEIYADADAAATLTPGPVTRLRLALITSVPGHAETDLERAHSIFRDLLSQSELLTPTEISLATIQLRDVEQRLSLARETERLQAESISAASSERRAVELRLSRAEEENRQLRKSLAEAEQKLEAITTIERSIREQSDNDNPQ